MIGFVERIRSEKDRRQVLVKLTTKGRKAFRAHDMFHKKMIEEALSDLTLEEERVFTSALTKVKTFFDEEETRQREAKSKK